MWRVIQLFIGLALAVAALGPLLLQPAQPERALTASSNLAASSAPARYLLITYNANYLWGQQRRVRRADPRGFIRTLNRHLDLMERYGVQADYYFTGLAAEKLAEWSPETLARLLNSGHGINYHGANRPPYPQLVEQIRGEDWEEDVRTAWTYEAEGVNPATGEHVGGIAAFREVFGREPFATGRFFEASILYVDKQLGARMGVGLKGNAGGPREDASYPPEFVQTSGMPYSLAEVFEALARALAHYSETGSLPDRVETHDLLGPTEYRSSDAMETSLSAEAVLEAAAAVAEGLVEKVPSQVAVGGFTVNPAEFLYLMAQEAFALAEGGPAPVSLRPVSLLPLSVVENEEADPLTKLQFWTYKPAVFSE